MFSPLTLKHGHGRGWTSAQRRLGMSGAEAFALGTRADSCSSRFYSLLLTQMHFTLFTHAGSFSAGITDAIFYYVAARRFIYVAKFTVILCYTTKIQVDRCYILQQTGDLMKATEARGMWAHNRVIPHPCIPPLLCLPQEMDLDCIILSRLDVTFASSWLALLSWLALAAAFLGKHGAMVSYFKCIALAIN